MSEIRREIRFLLNDREIRLREVGPTDTLLDFLRLDQRLRGTKEGCAEGDCGACTVLVGRLAGDELVYEPVTACIRLLPSLDGRHVVTIEALSEHGAPHPLQKALSEGHGSQCGFCTPGIVMSLYALWRKGGRPSPAQIETALQGNLCRCTGYAPIISAAQAAAEMKSPKGDFLTRQEAKVGQKLHAFNDGARIEVARGSKVAKRPADLEDLAKILAHEDATIIAGGTDVGLWVTKEQREISHAVFIDHLEELRQVEALDDAILMGGGVSYAQLEPIVAKRHPWMLDYWRRIGGEQVRAMGTIGGNIANGSPIGDTPPPFIALGAQITLRSQSGRRVIALEDFFIDYGRQDLRSGEFLENIRLPDPKPGALTAAYKISKRRDEDISAVSAGFAVDVENGVISGARLAFGGMAKTPKRAYAAEKALVGAGWEMASIDAAAAALAQDFSPISDMRASAAYRMIAAQNLLRRFYLEHHSSKEVRLRRRA